MFYCMTAQESFKTTYLLKGIFFSQTSNNSEPVLTCHTMNKLYLQHNNHERRKWKTGYSYNMAVAGTSIAKFEYLPKLQ